MTTALPVPAARRSPAPRLQLVGDHPAVVPARGADGGRIGYLVFLPANVDPVALMKSHGVRPEVHPLAPGTLRAPDPERAPHPGPVHPDPVHPDPVHSNSAHSDDAIRVDRDRRLVEVAGRELELTYLEFDLLSHFVAHPYTVHTRDALISGIWGYGHIGDGRTVDVHVARLRRKLGPAHRDRISTVRRVGYKYVPDQQ